MYSLSLRITRRLRSQRDEVIYTNSHTIFTMIFDLIQKRRAVFPAQYNKKPIAKVDLHRILEAANWAPTHRKTEPWRFKVMTGEAKARLGDFLTEKYRSHTPQPKKMKIKKLTENPRRAGAIIGICMQRDLQERLPEWEEVAAVAMAVQNMWLCCAELGIGAYWSSPSLIQYMDEFFDLNVGERCLRFFYMGYSDEPPGPGDRTPYEDKVVWIEE